jgi:sugar phosphate isomerase/epimerase
VTSSLVDRLTFMNGCMVRVPFRDLVPAVAAAGFEALTIWPNVWRHALGRDGFDLAGMKALLDDHGVVLTDVEVSRDWVPRSGDDATGPTGMAGERQEFFAVCSALGGSTVVAVHDAPSGLVLDRDAEAFAGLCDDAAEHGLRVALEFMPFSAVRDVQEAWALVNTAGRANGGLVFDLWHHVRSGCPDDAVRAVPASRIVTVQLADGPAIPTSPDLAAEARGGRLLPGTGEMRLATLLAALREMGVCADVGPELDVPVGARPVEELARELMAATTATLAASGWTPGQDRPPAG